MKKLITVLLILALLLPAASIASDSIVGIWYTYIELEDQGHELDIFRFDDDGSLFSSSYKIDKQGITTAKDYKQIGVWSNKDDHYYINLGFNGAKELAVEDSTFFFPVTDDMAIRIRKLEAIDYALDIRRLP